MTKIPTAPVRDGITLHDAFFSPKLHKFYHVTSPDSFTKFEAERTLDNWRNAAKGEGEHYKHSFYDGLIYELIRGTSDYPEAATDEAFQARVDAYTELFAAAQDHEGDGFVDTYTQLVFPKQRYGHNGGEAIWQHNTYNTGCLLEAGIHYYLSTGKTRLLDIAMKAVNYTYDHIGPAPKWNVPPEHSMIEGALAELCELMDEQPDLQDKLTTPLYTRQQYLELCDFFVRIHGRHEGRISKPRYMGEYCQDHAPVELQEEAVGHAVRAVLFYRGIAMLSRLENDEGLWNVARKIWNNITKEKMFINAGVGVSVHEEKFSHIYELPNDGYMETCATAALIFFAQEMLRIDASSEYADVIETALYNLMLEAVSDAGDQYTYVNPMQSKGDIHRWQWNDCPCCPPMIQKVFGQTDELVYSVGEDCLYVNQYLSSDLNCGLGEFQLEGNYPWCGKLNFTVKKAAAGLKAVKLRIPGWCEKYQITVNGSAVEAPVEKGYAVVENLHCGDVIVLDLDMPVRRMCAHPYVRADWGRVAIQRGPVLYCLEGVDNKGKTDREVAVDWQPETKWMENLCGGVMGISFKEAQGATLLAVPYFAWDNRIAGAMDVWLRQQGMQWEGRSIEGWEGKLYQPYNG